MPKKRREYFEDYDSDNYAYQDDDYYEDEYSSSDDDEDPTQITDEGDEGDTFEPTDLLDLPGKQKFDPNEYDFEKIMEDYNSGNQYRRDRAVEQAVYAMDALVKYVINRHYPTYREKHYEDMLQTGRMAVVETLGGYTGKCAPSSYFYTTIRHEIQVFIAEDVHRTTRHYAAMANKIRKAEIALSQIDGKEHHDDLTISVYTGLPLTTVIETRRQTIAADFVELNTNIDTEENSRDDFNPAAAYWRDERNAAIRNAVQRLSKTEAQVIALMYGLADESPIKPPEIARRLHLKTDQVRKIAQDACRKLGNDKQLQLDIGVHDQLTSERERSASAMPFVSVSFGHGENFFEDISEDDENSSEVQDISGLFKPMNLKD